MGSGRSTPCCSVTTEDVKQSHREGTLNVSSQSTPKSDERSPKGQGSLSGKNPSGSSGTSASAFFTGGHASSSERVEGNSSSSGAPKAVLPDGSGSADAASASASSASASASLQQVKSPRRKSDRDGTESEKSPRGKAVAEASEEGGKKEEAKGLKLGGSIAERRGFGFKQNTTKSGAPLSISTKKEKKRERRRIKNVESAHDYYNFGKSVMPSSHSGMAILFAERLEDGLEVVVKVRAKVNSFCDRSEEKEWRASTEFMLNLPETDGIAKLYEVLEDKKGYYVVMEKVQGQDLFETMTGKGLLPVAEVKEVLRQLLQALAELHGRNCIHKDLKLENIMFDRTPPPDMKVDWDALLESGKHSPVQVKLIDFDTVEQHQPATPKKAKDVLGTDQYIAQEAYDGNYSSASDIFAAGVIGYRLLTSKFPFKSDIFDDEAGDNWVGSPKMKEIRQKLCNYKIDWSHRVFTVEPQARELLRSMLAVNETHRPTAKEALCHPFLAMPKRRQSVPAISADQMASIAGSSSEVPATFARQSVGSVNLPHTVNDDTFGRKASEP
eukprot:TRINITY_DN39910_c0_g1_i1.p1 TRINITY_DN39910_c0_g1~~TRINITY_DN39910_c0_g1_i1.p1  ORF type:complete len:633 (-),score=136.33 TRINITY_DN39910_c0_g1_i1:52-1716(-)